LQYNIEKKGLTNLESWGKVRILKVGRTYSTQVPAALRLFPEEAHRAETPLPDVPV